MDIETIYRLYFRDVFLFLQGLTGSETLAEELTQETFFKALDGLKGFDGRQDVRAWLFTVARNAYYDHCRRAKRTAPLEAAADAAADAPDVVQLLADETAAFTVHQCLHALDEPYKEVFSLRVFGELPFEKIGAIFGHNAAWARVTYYRAKTKLHALLAEKTDTSLSVYSTKAPDHCGPGPLAFVRMGAAFFRKWSPHPTSCGRHRHRPA